MTPTTDDLNRNEKRNLYGSYHTNKLIKSKIDKLMHQMAVVECNLGIDSTDQEKKKAAKEQLLILAKIKKLDPIKYDILKKVI